MAKRKRIEPVHPGEVLAEEFMKPLKLTANKLALELRVPSNRITGIINKDRAISAETALRLARYFGTSAGFWMNLQAHFDLETASDEIAETIAREVNPRAA